MTHKEIIDQLKAGDRVVITFYPRSSRISLEKGTYLTAKQYEKIRDKIVLDEKYEGGLTKHFYKLK